MHNLCRYVTICPEIAALSYRQATSITKLATELATELANLKLDFVDFVSVVALSKGKTHQHSAPGP